MSLQLSQLFTSNTTVLAANSATWNSVYTTVNYNSALNWNYQGTDIKSLSSNWENTYTNFAIQSANNISVYTTVNSNSSNNWNYQGTDVKNLTSYWQNTYTTVNNNSSIWVLSGISVETDPIFTSWAQSNSANYQSVYTTVNSNSATWGTGGGGGSFSPDDANSIIGLSVFL